MSACGVLRKQIVRRIPTMLASLSMATMAFQSPSFAWRSQLYPDSWSPGYKDGQGRFLHDFSYAGYHAGEAAIPGSPPGSVIDATRSPYYADRSGGSDATSAIQRALDDAGNNGGGVVYLPAGTYMIRPQGGNNYALRIAKSRVVLRGAGPDLTRLYVNATYMRYKNAIQVSPSGGGSWTSPSGSSVRIARDLLSPTKTIPLASTSPFKAGDWVVIRGDVTSGFISEHYMQSYWNTEMTPQLYLRRVTAVSGKTITIDAPTRYYLKTRDNARVYRVAPQLAEFGIEQFSIGMRENPRGGLGNNDYKVQGTAAYEVHRCLAISVQNAVNGWIRKVHTYRPSANAHDWHIQSGGIELRQSRFITVTQCDLKKPQYRGEGGNGYLYTINANDILITQSVAEKGRHNFSHKSMIANGSVIHRSTIIDGNSLNSDFHMHLSLACLIDHVTFIRDAFEARMRPYGTSPKHGHSATQSVFWNANGQQGKSGAGYVVYSSQYGQGYVIGTRGAMSSVRLAVDSGTSPADYAEGVGQGGTLAPQSLYEDQLARRLGRAVPPPPAPEPTTVPPPPAPTGQLVAPVADAYVWDGSYASKNFGTAPELTVKGYTGTGYTRVSYLKFDLKGLTAAPSGATLRLTATALEGGSVPVKVFSVTNDAWTEGGLTWNTRPARIAPLAGATVSTAGTTYVFDVTAFAASQWTTDKIMTLAVADERHVNKFVKFDSREGLKQPALELVQAGASGQGLAPVADAYVRDGSYASQNFGTAAEVAVKDSPYAGSGFSRITYLKFNLGSLTRTLAAAKLKLTCRALQGGGVPVKVFSVSNDAWTEAGITWNNRPPVTAQLASGSAASAGATLAFDVTPFVASQATGDKVVTFAVLDDSNRDLWATFGSREGGTKPVLELTTK